VYVSPYSYISSVHILLCLRPHAAIYAVYVWQADEFDGPDELMTLSEEVDADYSNTVRAKMEGVEAGAQVLSLLTLLVQKVQIPTQQHT
jgi:hypothetical protein